MIHNDILNQLQYAIKTVQPPLLRVIESPLDTGGGRWEVGQRLSATVLAALPNGRFQVAISDSILEMELPRNTQAGDNIEMTVYSNRAPRLTFLLQSRDIHHRQQHQEQQQQTGHQNSTLENSKVSLSNTATMLGTLLAGQAAVESKKNALTSNVIGSQNQTKNTEQAHGTNETDEGEHSTHHATNQANTQGTSRLATTMGEVKAQLESGLLNQAKTSQTEAEQALTQFLVTAEEVTPQTNTPRGAALNVMNPLGFERSATIQHTQQVLSTNPTEVTQLTQALLQSIEKSGLFYESHLVAWLNETRSLADILQEPQAKITPNNLDELKEKIMNLLKDAQLLHKEAEYEQNAAIPLENAAEIRQEREAKLDKLNQQITQLVQELNYKEEIFQPVDEAALPLLQQQMELADNPNQILWQGQVWQKQSMEWRLKEDLPEGEQNKNLDKHLRQWHSEIRLNLPSLGEVVGRVTYQGGRTKIELHATDPETQTLFKTHLLKLQENLESAGVQVLGMLVKPPEFF